VLSGLYSAIVSALCGLVAKEEFSLMKIRLALLASTLAGLAAFGGLGWPWGP
jgi:hypothetical protein